MKQGPSFYGLPEELARFSTAAHPDTVTHVVPVGEPGHFVSASIDGFLHHFSVVDSLLESLKIVKLHSAPVTDMAATKRYFATVSLDKTAKLLTAGTVEVVRVWRFEEVPECVCVVDDPAVSADVWLVVAFRDLAGLSVFKLDGPDGPDFSVDTGRLVVSRMCYSSVQRRLFVFAEPNLSSVDIEGVLKERQFAPLQTLPLPAPPGALCLSHNHQMLAFCAADHLIRIINTATWRPTKRFDETAAFYERLVEAGRMDRAVCESKWRVEAELQRSPYAGCQRICFDRDDRALLYPSLLGVKAVDVETNKAIAIYGKNGEYRPICVALQEMHAQKVMSVDFAASDNPKALFGSPSVLLCTSFRGSRVMIYNDSISDSVHSPADAFPTHQDSAPKGGAANAEQEYQPGHTAIIRTTLGDITIELYPQQTPLTVQNFCTLSRRHHYDGLLFHRVIRGFILQTGCPRGDGTGGESMWGGYFRNELSADLKHDRPFTVSMANSGGARTNGSQFFITTIRAPWLDRKHTVFGRVVAGEDVVRKVEVVEVDRLDRPKQDVKIITIEIL